MSVVSVTDDVTVSALKDQLAHLKGEKSDDGLWVHAASASDAARGIHEYVKARAEPFENGDSNPYVKGSGGGGGGGSGCVIL